MLCPTCTTERLAITERRGIEIDYCPKCRGIWLDRGELDKLIEASATAALPPPTAQDASLPYPAPHERRHWDDDDDDDDWGRRDGTLRKKKRKGFLGDLFDF